MSSRTLQGWKRSLYIIAFAQLVSEFGFSLIFPFLPFYVEELGSKTHFGVEFWAGMVFSAQGLAMMIVSPLWGTVADRYGRKIMVERAMLGGAVVMLLMAFVQSAEELVILRTLQGFITGTVAATSAMVAALVPREHVGYAMGVMQTAFWIGIAMGPVIGGAISDAIGYRALFVLTSALLFIGGTSVLVGVKEEFHPVEAATRGMLSFVKEWQQVIRTPGVLSAYAVRFLNQTSRNILVPFIPLFAQMLLTGYSNINTITGVMISLSSAATVLTSIYAGRLGDRIGHRRVLAVSLLLGAIIYLPQGLVGSVWQLIFLQMLAGAAVGGIGPALNALLARYVRQGHEGAVYGLDNSTISASRAIAPMIGASIVAALSIRWLFAATAVVLLLSVFTVVSMMPDDRMPAAS